MRGLDTGTDPTSQNTHIDSDLMDGKSEADSMKNLKKTGSKTFGETGEASSQCERSPKKSGTILEELAMELNDANNKARIQSNHYLGNPTRWAILV